MNKPHIHIHLAKKRSVDHQAKDEKPYEPDEIDRGGRRYVKTNEMIPFNGKPARKYKEKDGIRYITREVESGTVHDSKAKDSHSGLAEWKLDVLSLWPSAKFTTKVNLTQALMDGMIVGEYDRWGNPDWITKPTKWVRRQALADRKAKDAVNHMGEKQYQTYNAWRVACRAVNSNVTFEGDKDICNAKPGVGEWDGETGVVYKQSKES